MKLFQRLKNIWRLGGIQEVTPEDFNKYIEEVEKLKEPRKKAKIIKMNDPIKEFLKINNNE